MAAPRHPIRTAHSTVSSPAIPGYVTEYPSWPRTPYSFRRSRAAAIPHHGKGLEGIQEGEYSEQEDAGDEGGDEPGLSSSSSINTSLGT